MTIESKVIPLESALELAMQIPDTLNLNQRESYLLEALVLSCPQIQDGSDVYILFNDLKGFLQNYSKAIREKDSTFLYRKRGYRGPLVDMETFLESPEYMGMGGFIRPVVKYTLEDIFSTPGLIEIVLSGATGWGKSFTSRMIMARLLYQLSMLWNPQAEYDLSPGSLIILPLQSLTAGLAKKVLFDPLHAEVSASKYFRDNFQFDRRISSEMKFPNQVQVIPISGSELATLGLNVYSACFLENHPYLSADGTIKNMSPKNKAEPYTLIDNVIQKGRATKTVRTGFKSLVKLHFINGESIICSGNQIFEGEYGEWIQASQAFGRRFKFSNLSTLRNSGYLSNEAFAASSQNDFEGVPFEVSKRSINTEGIKIRLPKGDLYGVREGIRTNNGNTSKDTQYNSDSISDRFPRGSSPIRYVQKKARRMGSEEYKASEATVSRFRGEVLNKYRRALGQDARGYEKEDGRPKEPFGCKHCQKGKMEESYRGRKKYTTKEASRTFNQPKEYRYWVSLHIKEWGRDQAAFKTRNSSGFCSRLCRSSLEIRRRHAGIHNSEWRGACIHSRLHNLNRLRGSEDSLEHGNKSLVESKEALIQTNNNRHEITVANEVGLLRKLVNQRECKDNVFFRDEQAITGTLCIRVDEFRVLAPVCDLEDVGTSHMFLAGTQNGFVVAKNCISEANYFAVIENSRYLKSQGTDKMVFDQAERSYTNIVQRMKNRFQERGSVPGLMVLDSAVNYPGDFLSRKKEDALRDPSIYVAEHAIWDVISRDKLTPGTFFVEVGDANKSSRIIANENMARPDAKVIEVPVDYRRDFDRDIEFALRDFAGIVTGHRHAFMPYRDAITDAANIYEETYHGNTLFRMESCIITELFAGPPVWDEIINQDYLEELSFNKDAEFAVHLDIGISRDATGLAIGHIQTYKELPSSSYYSQAVGDFVEVINVQAPVICIDGILQVTPPSSGEVDLDMLKGLCLFLTRKLNLKFATLDRFESAIFLQGFQKLKVRSGQVSVVATPVPYMELKSCYIEGRIIHPRHSLYIDELINLEYDPKKQKIDHSVDNCFTGDTRVALLDGSNPTFEELGERFPNGESFEVFSMSNTGVTVGTARNPRITGIDAKLIEITLDNFQVIRCTRDHLFMTLGMDWIEARSLRPDISLMPFNRSIQLRGGWSGYSSYFDPIAEKTQFIHRMVAECMFGDVPKNMVVHHIDNVRLNNSSDNLVLLSRAKHAAMHTRTRHEEDKSYVSSLREGHKKYRESGGNEKSRENMLKLFDSGVLKRGRAECIIEGCSSPSSAKGMCDKHYHQDARKKKFQVSQNKNHRIISVRELPYTMNVWDIEVDEYHNFALTSGIFVHNSKDLADCVAAVTHILMHKVARFTKKPVYEAPQQKEFRNLVVGRKTQISFGGRK